MMNDDRKMQQQVLREYYDATNANSNYQTEEGSHYQFVII